MGLLVKTLAKERIPLGEGANLGRDCMVREKFSLGAYGFVGTCSVVLAAILARYAGVPIGKLG
jgi:hypothetical protein